MENAPASTVTQPTLHAVRLTLRPVASEDASHLARVFAGAGVRRYLFDNEEVGPETVSAIVAESLRQSANGLGLWLIARDGDVLGCIGLHRAPPATVRIVPAFDGEIEAVVALMEAHWGAGYAKEALDAVLGYAMDILKARRVVAVIDVPNGRSHALFKRSGFREIGSGQGPLYEAIAYERTSAAQS
jgi:ribosomal-protein-alanine N-acetyltransferase